jgi:hypothetical protein
MQTTSAPSVVTISTGHDYKELTRNFRELSVRITNLIEEQKRPSATVIKDAVQHHRSRSTSRRRYNSSSSNKSRSPARQDSKSTMCWYHRHHGEQAQRFTKPVSINPRKTHCRRQLRKTPALRLPTAFHYRQKNSNRRFLIHTGSDLFVYPRKFIPQRSSRVNYDLCAANGTTISTYGWLSLGIAQNIHMAFRNRRRYPTTHRS